MYQTQVNFDEFKEVFVSLLTQSHLFNTSANNYSNMDNLEKDQFNRTQSNLTVTDQQQHINTATTNNNQIKMNNYHQLDSDELNTNRKQNGRTNQTNRRCKKSKKSTNNTIKFDSSFDKKFDKPFKENDDNQENSTKHLNVQTNKQMTNLNISKPINLDKDHHNRKQQQQQNLNDRLDGQSNKKMRNSSSGAEEGYSSLDDCGSTSSQSSCTIAESPDLVSNDEDKNEKLSSLHSYSHHINLNNKNKNEKNLDLNSDESSDHSTVSSTTELNKTTASTDDFNQDELDQQPQLESIEQSTEQYLSSIWSELNVGKEGYLTLNELFIICQHTMGKIDEELVKQLFDRLDEDKDGKVSFDELLKQLSSNLTNDLTNTSGLNEELNNDYQLDNDKVLNENQQIKTEFNRECNINYNTTNPNSNSRRSSLNLELSPYTTTTYKNYFSPSSENELNFKEDHVDNINESFFSSLDSNLVQKSSSKHQRTNSFTANADCLLDNVPSSSTNTQTSKQATVKTNQQDLKHQQQNQVSANSLSSFSCCCSNKNCLTNNNQSKSDYEFINNSKVFCHKRTNSVGQAHLNQLNNHCKNCIQNNCNKLLNSSSSSSLANNSSIKNSSSTANSSSIEQTVNQTLSSSKNLNTNLSSIDEQSLSVEISSSLNSSLNTSLNEQAKLRNKCLKTSKEDQSAGQGDIYCQKKRNSITDKFNKSNNNVSSNLSSRFSSSATNESEDSQLLNSMHHQFNSSHLYHHQSILNKEHLSQEPELNEDDFCNLTGFGNLISLDPFGYGYVFIFNLQ